MFKCNSCGHIFEEGEEYRWKEAHGFSIPPYEEWSGCPLCHSGYDEVKPCKICGTYEHNIDSDYCDECKEVVKKRFTDFVDKEFNEEERKLLNELYDGELI